MTPLRVQGSCFNVNLLLRHTVSTLSSGAVNLSQHLILELLRRMRLNTLFDRLNTFLASWARVLTISTRYFRRFRHLRRLHLFTWQPTKLTTLLSGFKIPDFALSVTSSVPRRSMCSAVTAVTGSTPVSTPLFLSQHLVSQHLFCVSTLAT